MNLLDAIRSQVLVADYERCWLSAPPLSFDDFISFLNSALQKQLPDGLSDFVIGIESQAENRIGLRGAFVLEQTKYTIFGDFVYLPGMNAFRGRPGYTKCFEHTYEMAEMESSHQVENRTLAELFEANFLESSAGAFPKAAISAL